MTERFTDVLIVIPCLNEAGTLQALLRQMIDETGRAQIVVADGGSTDGSQEIVSTLALQESRITLLDNPARIQSAGINQAVRSFGSEARWLLRVDAHCHYPAGYLEQALATAEQRGANAVVVPMVSRGKGCFQLAAAAAQNSWLGTGGSPHRHIGTGKFVDHGHHCLMDRALFERVGGYREDMSHNEDAELDTRLILAGARIWLEPALALIYQPRASARSLWCQYWGYGRGRCRTLRLHRAKPKLRQLLPVAVPGALLAALVSPAFPIAALPIALWACAAVSLGVFVARREPGLCSKGAGIAAMIMHLAWGGGFLRELLQRARQ